MAAAAAAESQAARRPGFTAGDLFHAWWVASAFSGLPSTAHALWFGGDPLEATRAAGAMLLPPGPASLPRQVAAAGLVHGSVSLLWLLAFAAVLPRRHPVAGALAGSALVAWLDLKVIAPRRFPSVAALPFWPQFADHLAWGGLVGATLWVRQRRRRPPP